MKMIMRNNDEAAGVFEVDFSAEITEAKENKTLNKPFRTPKGPKKFSVYVKNEKGNVVKVNFGDPTATMRGQNGRLGIGLADSGVAEKR